MSARANALRPIALGGLQILWELARVPILVVLLLLAPVVEVLCGGALLLGILVSIVYEISGAGGTYPFWHMILLSLGFGAFIILHYAAISFLLHR
jgi:hypothetical protein